MSQFALPVAELKPALIGLGKVLTRKAPSPVLASIRLERNQDGWITLAATDGEHFVTVRLEQPAEGEPESLLVSFDELLKVTRTCHRDEQIFVEQDRADLVSIRHVIRSQFMEQKVQSCTAGDFPVAPAITGEPVPIPEPVRRSICKAFACASTDPTRLILNGAYLDVSEEDCHQVVATDGRHLYSSNSFRLPLRSSINLPAHPFLEWKEFRRDGEWQIQLGPQLGNSDSPLIEIRSRRWTFLTRQHEGNYPSWRQIIPGTSETKTRIEIDPAAVDGIVNTILKTPDHDRLNSAIGLEVNGDKVQLLGKSGTAEYWTRVDVPAAKITGQPVLIFLNRNFLTKALRFGLTSIDLIDSMSPLRFSSGGQQMIVMPVRAETVPPPVTTTADSVPERNGKDAANPVNPEAEPEPTTTPETHEMNGIAKDSTSPEESGSPAPRNHTSTIEESLALVENLKASLQNHFTTLRDLGTKLRLIQREQRNTEREFHSIRSTLRTLQSVKL